MLARFDTLGRMSAWSRFADITNSCSRDLLIPAISFSNCLHHSSESSMVILMSRLSVDNKWRECGSVRKGHEVDFKDVRNLRSPTS